MKKLVCYLIIIIPLLYGCQSQYENPPYNEIERKIRLLPENIDRLVIYESWQKMDSISYIRLNNVKSIIIAPEVDSIPPWITLLYSIPKVYTKKLQELEYRMRSFFIFLLLFSWKKSIFDLLKNTV